MMTSSPCFQFTGLATFCFAVSCSESMMRDTLGLLDVVRPLGVAIDRVDAQADDLDVTPVELGLDLCHVTELGRTDRGEILWVRKEHGPGITDPVMEADAALGRFCLKIRGDIADLESHFSAPSFAGMSHRTPIVPRLFPRRKPRERARPARSRRVCRRACGMPPE